MNEENEQFSETVRKMLEIMEYDTPYTRKNTLWEKNWGFKSPEMDSDRKLFCNPHLR